MLLLAVVIHRYVFVVKKTYVRRKFVCVDTERHISCCLTEAIAPYVVLAIRGLNAYAIAFGCYTYVIKKWHYLCLTSEYATIVH